MFGESYYFSFESLVGRGGGLRWVSLVLGEELSCRILGFFFRYRLGVSCILYFVEVRVGLFEVFGFGVILFLIFVMLSCFFGNEMD